MHVDPDELTAYHDGELSPEHAVRVEQALARDPQSRAMLAEWRVVGAAVRDWSERVSRSRATGTDRIMRELQGRRTVAAVVPLRAGLEPHRRVRAACADEPDSQTIIVADDHCSAMFTASARLQRGVASAPQSTPSSVERRTVARRPVRVSWRQPAGAMLVVAAVAVLLVKTIGFVVRHAPTMDESALHATPGLAGRDANLRAEEQPGAAIETLDLGEHQGTIFLVSAGSEVTPVVWVEDDSPSEDDDRERTL